MRIFTQLHELRAYLKGQKSAGATVGLIPTMGALHKGHLSLVQSSQKANNLTVCSIYVNPTQFNNSSDLALYPRTLETDKNLLEEIHCDILFAPDNTLMYVEPPKLRFNFGHLEEVMEGRFRPGHFNGVATVVSKFFHMIEPDKAYFGQKDLQQYLIIKQLVKDLSFGVEVICHPIIREESGLALSSRNARLTPEQKINAANLNQALLKAKSLLNQTTIEAVKQAIKDELAQINDIQLEYFEIVDGDDLSTVTDLQKHRQIALCIAAYLGKVRLIDNEFLFS